MTITRNFTSGSPPAADNVSTNAVAILVTGAVAAGDLLTGPIAWQDGASTTVTSVTDTAGNSWTQVGSTVVDSNSPSSCAIWCCLSAKASSANTNTVTFHLSGAVQSSAAIQSVTSSVAVTWAVDKTTGTAGTTSPDSSGSVTTTSANEYVVAASYGDGASCTANGSITPQYTHTPLGGLSFQATGDAILTSTTTIAGTFSYGGGNFSAIIATFSATPASLLPTLPVDDTPPPTWRQPTYAKRLAAMEPLDLPLTRVINARRNYPSPVGLGGFLLFGSDMGPLTSPGPWTDDATRPKWTRPFIEDANLPAPLSTTSALPSAGWYDAPTPQARAIARPVDDLPMSSPPRSFGALGEDPRPAPAAWRRPEDLGPPPKPSYQPLFPIGGLSPDEARGSRGQAAARRVSDDVVLSQAFRSPGALVDDVPARARVARPLVDDATPPHPTYQPLLGDIGALQDGPPAWRPAPARVDDAPVLKATTTVTSTPIGWASEDRARPWAAGPRFDELVLGRSTPSIGALGEDTPRGARAPRANVDDNAPPHPTYRPLFPIGGLGPDETRTIPWPRWRAPEDTHALHPSYFPLLTGGVLDGGPPARWVPLRRAPDDAWLGTPQRSPGAILDSPPARYRGPALRLDDAPVLKATAAAQLSAIGGIGDDVRPPWRGRFQPNDDRPLSPPVSPPALTRMGWAVDEPRPYRTIARRPDDVHPLKTTTTVTLTSIGWAADDVRARARGRVVLEDASVVSRRGLPSIGWAAPDAPALAYRRRGADDGGSTLGARSVTSSGWLVDEAKRVAARRVAPPDEAPMTALGGRTLGWLGDDPGRAWRRSMGVQDLGPVGNPLPRPTLTGIGGLADDPVRGVRRAYRPVFDDPVLDALLPAEVRIVATLFVSYPVVGIADVSEVYLAVGTVTEPVVAVADGTEPIVAVATRTIPEP